jgi:hypothetical protein
MGNRRRRETENDMDTADRYAWNYLVDQWGDAYAFEHEPGTAEPYTAQRRDNGLVLRAKTVESLQAKVYLDYRERPVPRSVAP